MSTAQLQVMFQLSQVPTIPAYRYERVLGILEDPKHVSVMRKIVDFGCAECKFLGRLKGLPRAREVVGVDVDATLLESFVSVSDQMQSIFCNALP